MIHPALQPGEIAVVTGAALGIGRALSRRFAAMGLNVAMLDTDEAHLAEAAAEVGHQALAIPCNVGDMAALQDASTQIQEHWGKTPSVLINNAATRVGRGMWAPLEDWRQVIDVNLMGVVHGLRAFVPAMQASDAPGLVVNVGSKQGITNPPGHPAYNMAKAAVKSLTEGLAHDLRQDANAQISVHLLIPGWTTTGLNQPKPGAWMPDQVVDFMLEAVARGSFYILCPDGEVSTQQDHARVLWGAEDITQDRPALSRWHPDWKDRFQDG